MRALMIDAYRTSASPPLGDPAAQPPPTPIVVTAVARSSPTMTALLTVVSVALGAFLAAGRTQAAPTVITVPVAAAAPAAPALLQNAAPSRSVLTSSLSGGPTVFSPRVPSPPAILSTSGLTSHDPLQLLSRARRLAASGVDLRVLEVEVPSIVVERAKTQSNRLGASSMSPYEERGRAIGLRLVGIRTNSPFAHAGLESNDVVVAVNGFAVSDTSWYDAAVKRTGSRSLTVLEVIRNGERVVLAVHWTA